MSATVSTILARPRTDAAVLATYAAWLLVLVLLYLACRWFADLKRQRRDWWLSYL